MIRLLAALPNLVTALRLVAVPMAIHFILAGRLDWAFVVFLAAGLSDALDGLLARWLRAQSVLGSYLDPLADKLLLVGVYACLGLQGSLPLWLVGLVLLRDAALLAGAGNRFLRDRRRPLRPLAISKANTVCQVTLVAWVLLAQGVLPAETVAAAPFAAITPLLIALVALTTILSGLAYLRLGLRSVRARVGADGGPNSVTLV